MHRFAPPRVAVPRLLLPLALAAAACGDGGGGSTPVVEVTAVRIAPVTAEIAVGEELALAVEVDRADGSTGAPSSVEFSVEDPTVVAVSADGTVTGLSEGETRIAASVGGIEGTSDVAVVSRIAAETVVVDSTDVALVSTDEERQSGELRFVGATAEDFVIGAIVAGSHGPGFLRRVTAVETRGDTVVLSTEFASLDEAVDAGTFESSVSLDIGAPQSAMVDGVQWGRTEVAYTAPGVTAGTEGFVFDGAVLYQNQVCGTDPETGAEVCGTFTVDVPSGNVEFTPTVDVGATFSWLGGLTEFHAIGTGTLSASMDLRATAAVAAEISGERTFATVKRFFWGFVGAVPVEGHIRLDLVGKYTAKVDIEGSVTSGASGSASVTAGARYDASGWSATAAPSGSFETRPLGWDLETGASLRFDVKPVFTMILYEFAGPSASAYPYVNFAGTVGIDDCSYSGSVKAGMDMDVAFNIEIFGHEVDSYSTTVEGASTVLLSKQGRLVEALHAVGGENQEGEPERLLSLPLEVLVTDSDVMPSEGIEVVFEPEDGSGSVSPASAVTDANGQVKVYWTLGPDEGTQTVTARTDQCEGANDVVFTAEAVAPEEPEPVEPQVEGTVRLVRALSSTPLAGATVTAELVAAASSVRSGEGGPLAVAANPTTTDENGHFQLAELGPGTYVLVVSHESAVETRVFQVAVTADGLTSLGTIEVVEPSASSGSLSVTVRRSPSDGFLVPNATVELRSGVNAPDSEEVVLSGSTGGQGEATQGKVTFYGASPGTYTVKVVAPGGGVNRAETVVIGGSSRGFTIYVHP